MSATVKVVAVLTAREQRAAELETLLRGMVPASRAEPGNLQYDLWQDKDNPGRFFLEELYRDSDAANSHRATPHFQNYVAHINDLAERMPIVVHAVDAKGARA
ncbi:quinol monooxygenase YgiN [Paraburkholderia sp. GAS199]|uniref:putative quinol monooxygenase n=1 Tax=Paraburkholderia sp. GAS199 TaxID=3035126 RepID=UPI003D1E2705